MKVNEPGKRKLGKRVSGEFVKLAKLYPDPVLAQGPERPPPPPRPMTSPRPFH